MNITKNSRDRDARVFSVVCGLIIALVALPDEAKAQTTTRVSVSSTGIEGNGDSGDRSLGATISANGRIVAFPSEATNLIDGDTNGFQDIFVYDLQTKEITRVSVGPGGQESFNDNIVSAIGESPSLSGDGRFVAWSSSAANLVPNDTNGVKDIFVHDRQTGQTTRVSIDTNGVEANDASHSPILSGDGRFVAFESLATNLVPNDTNKRADIFVHDRQTGQTTRVSVNSSGEEANAGGQEPALSTDGRIVAFRSDSNDLVPGDTSTQCVDVFVHDRDTGETTRVNVGMGGQEAEGCNRFRPFRDWPSLNSDGRFVSFVSDATNLVPGDTNNVHDVFVHDRQTGETIRASVSSSGVPGNGASGVAGTENFRNHRLSADSKLIVFSSQSSNLAPGSPHDLYIHNLLTGETIGLKMGQKGTLGGPNLFAINATSELIAFVSNSFDVVPGDTNKRHDVFVYHRGTSITKKKGNTDLDGNGTSDLLWRNTRTGSTAIWLLNGTGIGAASFPGGVPLAWQVAGIGDVNGDGKADVIWRHTTSATVAIWLMNGTTITSVGFPASVPTAWSLQAVGDLNGDDKADLVWRNSNDGNTAIWLMNGTRIAASGFLGKVSLAWQLAGVGDVDADGKADLIWRNGTSHAVAIWMMNGLTMTSSGFPGNASPDLQIAGVGDVNGDGKADLIWRNTNSGDVAVWILNGTTIASSGIVDRLPSQWQIAQVGDADGDGKADVIWYDTTTGAVVCWLLNGLTIASEAFPGKVSTDWIIAGRPVAPPLSITTASILPAGTVNKSYSITLAKSGGTPSFSWTVFSGSLPPGLTLNPSTGQISGTPTTAGKFLVTVRVRDSGNPAQSAQELFSLTINPPPSPPPTGGGGGKLTITGAPAIVGGSFTPNQDVSASKVGPLGIVIAGEVHPSSHAEGIQIFFDYVNSALGLGSSVGFSLGILPNTQHGWACVGSASDLSNVPICKGVTVNRTGGTVTFLNTVLEDLTGTGSVPSITVNGTLTFPPF
jgi:putative Ig domain-containing protein/VCBS repeat protein/WD40 repeat protein